MCMKLFCLRYNCRAGLGAEYQVEHSPQRENVEGLVSVTIHWAAL
jgi:hypothetical protein